jgi:site-specific DNA recombinase
MAAIYARVSSEQQREEKTIARQTASLIEFAKSRELEVPKEWVFEDEGYCGARLERPGLERVCVTSPPKDRSKLCSRTLPIA